MNTVNCQQPPNQNANAQPRPDAGPPFPLSAFSLSAFPEIPPWPSPVQGHVLLDSLLHELQRFVVFPKWAAETFALWLLHTYAFHLRNITTYIAIESPEKECGKSTLLTVLSSFVNRPVVSSNITPSAFFRIIEELQPTLLIDEADTNLRGRDELRGILNAGYHRPTAFVWRVAYDAIPEPEPPTILTPRSDDSSDQPDELAPRTSHFAPRAPSPVTRHPSGRLARYSCWCPKAIAAIGRLHETLASRCIVIRMHRKTEGEACDRLKLLDTAALKSQCARFILDHSAAISAAEPSIPAGLANRAADVWEPLLAIADLAGGRWPDLARQAAVALAANARDRSPIGALLLDIFIQFFRDRADRLFSRDLVVALAGAPDRPWAELHKGKSVTDLWLAQQLRPYGVRPRSIRIGASNAKGYLLDDLRDVFKRYIPHSEIEALRQDLNGEPDTQPSTEAPPAAPASRSADFQSAVSQTSSLPGSPATPSSETATTAPPKRSADFQSAVSQTSSLPGSPSTSSSETATTAPPKRSADFQSAVSQTSSLPGSPTTPSSETAATAPPKRSADFQSAVPQTSSLPGSEMLHEPTLADQTSDPPEPEICLECGASLDPLQPGSERRQTHCPSCRTPISAPPCTSRPEKCAECGAVQPVHGYNAARHHNTCPNCRATLPPLDPKAPVPWLPRSIRV